MRYTRQFPEKNKKVDHDERSTLQLFNVAVRNEEKKF